MVTIFSTNNSSIVFPNSSGPTTISVITRRSCLGGGRVAEVDCARTEVEKFFFKNRTSVILQMQIYLLMRSFGFWQYNLISGTQMTSICTTTWQGIFSQNNISSKLTSDIFSLAWKGLSLERRLGSPKFFLTITILTIASRSKFVNKSFHCFIKESAMSSIFWLPACSTSCWLSWVQSCWRTIPSWDSVP